MDIIIIQIITVIVNIYIANTKHINRIYITNLIFNLCNMALYVFNGDKATAIVYTIVIIRSIVYIFREKLNCIAIPIITMIVQASVGLFTIERPEQLLTISVTTFVCYYMWFWNDKQKLRVGNIINNGTWFVYNTMTGLYIVAISRIIVVAANVIALYKNRNTDAT